MAKKASELTEEELKLPPLPEMEGEGFFSRFLKKKEEARVQEAKVPAKPASVPKAPAAPVKIKVAPKEKAAPAPPRPPVFTKPESSLLNKLFSIKKNPFRTIEPEFQLWLSDGRVVKSLRDLGAFLENMDDSTFEHHVSAEKNDFADWVRDVVREEGLSGEIRASRTKEDMEFFIKKFEKEKLMGKKEIKHESASAEIEKAIENVKGKGKVKVKPVPIKPIEHPEMLSLPQKSQLDVPPPPAPPEITIETKIKKTAKEKLKMPVPALEKVKVEEKRLLEEEKTLKNETELLEELKVDLSEKRTEFMDEVAKVGREEAEALAAISKPAPMLTALPAPSAQEKPQPEDKMAAVINILNDARNRFHSGDYDGARKALAEASELLGKARAKAEEKRRINLDILDLETDIKLAALG